MTVTNVLAYLETEKSKFSRKPPKQRTGEVKRVTKTKNTIPSITSGFSPSLLEERMRAKLIEDYKKGKSYSRPYYSVTEIIYCLRKAYFSRMKYEVDPSDIFKFPYLYLINQVGNVVHKVIQNLYSLSEVEKVIVSEKYKVKGRIDGLLSPDVLVEIKTIDEDKFRNLQVPQAHIDQCQIYCFILNEDYGYTITSFDIVYVSRCLKKIQPLSYKYEKELGRKLINRAKVLDLAIKNTTPVPAEFCTSDECRFCEYKKYCNCYYKPAEEIHDFQKFDEPIFLL